MFAIISALDKVLTTGITEKSIVVLERVLIDSGIALEEAHDIERKLLKDVKRRAHYYGSPLPPDGDVLGWLALRTPARITATVIGGRAA